MRRSLLSARYEVRADGLKNTARWTRETANRLAWTLRTRGCNVEVFESR